MANWFYFDSTGNKLGPVDSATLKLLAQHGAITPETPIETETGRKAKAGDIKGLEFAPAAPPSHAPGKPRPGFNRTGERW